MRYIFSILLIATSAVCNAQKENVQIMALPITDYITKLNDSIQIVQILLPDGLSVKDKAVGLLKPKRKSTDADSINIGYGKCNLIKGDYYYFTINVDKRSRLPREGDLLYIYIDLPGVYTGILFKAARHAITFSKIDDTPLLELTDVRLMSDKKREDELIDSFVEEIKFTAKTMMTQNDNQDINIESGPYKGKKMFATMLEVKPNDIIDFLKYIDARPTLYAGYNWKFSEIFATWVSAGAPKVIEDN